MTTTITPATDLGQGGAPPASRRRAHRRRRVLTALAGVALMVVSACVPSDFVRHQAGPNWSWFGPRNWLASHGTNGILISSPTGAQQVGMAFAPIPCAPGQTALGSANNFFPRGRAMFRDGSGLAQWQTRSFSTPRRLAGLGPNYFRQDITFAGRNNGALMRGEGSIDYAITRSGCTYIFRSRVTPNSQFDGAVGRLRAISNNINYFGSGVTF